MADITGGGGPNTGRYLPSTGGAVSGALTVSGAITAPTVQSPGTTSLALGTQSSGEVLRINDLTGPQTSRLDFSFINATNRWVLGAAGTGTNVAVSSSGSGAVYLLAAGSIQLVTGIVGSAVNYLQVTGAAGTNSPILSATGTATNLDITLTAKGTGLPRSTAGLGIGGSAGPTWTSGTGAPASTQPVSSLYSRTDGTAGARLYVSAGAGTWTPVATV